VNNRRLWVGTALCGWLVASCASQPTHPRVALDDALRLLPTMGTAAVLTDKFGEPDYRATFFDDDPKNPFNADNMSREFWKKISIETPEGLIGTLPIGTAMLAYYFIDGPAMLNATRGALWVCVDGNSRIVGWFYSSSLQGYEKYSRRE